MSKDGFERRATEEELDGFRLGTGVVCQLIAGEEDTNIQAGFMQSFLPLSEDILLGKVQPPPIQRRMLTSTERATCDERLYTAIRSCVNNLDASLPLLLVLQPDEQPVYPERFTKIGAFARAQFWIQLQTQNAKKYTGGPIRT